MSRLKALGWKTQFGILILCCAVIAASVCQLAGVNRLNAALKSGATFVPVAAFMCALSAALLIYFLTLTKDEYGAWLRSLASGRAMRIPFLTCLAVQIATLSWFGVILPVAAEWQSAGVVSLFMVLFSVSELVSAIKVAFTVQALKHRFDVEFARAEADG